MFEDVSDPGRKSIWKERWPWIRPVDSDEANRTVRWTCVGLAVFVGNHLWSLWARLTVSEVWLGGAAIGLAALVWFTRSGFVSLILAAESLSFGIVTFQEHFAVRQSDDDFHALELAVFVPCIAAFWLYPRCLDYYRFRQEERQRLQEPPEIP